MTEQAVPKRYQISDAITPKDVQAVRDIESSRPEDYRTALSLVGRFSRRYLDSEDVAAIAAVLLGEAMAQCADLTKAASLATYRAASEVSALNVAQGQAIERPMGDTLAVAEDYAPHPYLPRAVFTAPDACTVWTAQNRLAAMARVMATDVRVCRRILTVLETWARTQSVSAVQRALGLPTGGRGAALIRAEIDDTLRCALLVAQSDAFAVCLETIAPTGRVNDGARDWARDSRVATSGPASLVVTTRPDGTCWVTLPGTSEPTMLTDDGAAYTLAHSVGRVPAYVGGTAREVQAQDIIGAQDRAMARPARRPQGVSAGMRYGNGLVAGTGAPEMRPSAPAKRKRDGGIGSAMIPA